MGFRDEINREAVAPIHYWSVGCDVSLSWTYSPVGYMPGPAANAWPLKTGFLPSLFHALYAPFPPSRKRRTTTTTTTKRWFQYAIDTGSMYGSHW